MHAFHGILAAIIFYRIDALLVTTVHVNIRETPSLAATASSFLHSNFALCRWSRGVSHPQKGVYYTMTTYTIVLDKSDALHLFGSGSVSEPSAASCYTATLDVWPAKPVYSTALSV